MTPTSTIEQPPHPTPYATPGQQLVLEIYITSLERSIAFYKSLGFTLDWSYPGIFAQFSWDGCLLFLKVKPGSDKARPNQEPGSGNIRIMIPDVDAKYKECKKLGYPIEQELGDRLLVLRDFIVTDPDGFGVRFGSYLSERGRVEQLRGQNASATETNDIN